MGSNAITTITIGICLMFGAMYFATDSHRYVENIFEKLGISENAYVKKALEFLKEINVAKTSSSTENDLPIDSEVKGQLLLTPEQLRKYDGGPDSTGLYLAILGEVFDVEKGAQHYKPGGGYAFFSGRDATRAYVTGDFSEGGLTDDVSDLDSKSLASLKDWISFYAEEYKPVGKVIGRYYDKKGQPTKALLSIRENMNEPSKSNLVEEKDAKIFPPCNSEWSKEIGSRVWCTKKSGGVERSWVGVPRELHIDGKDPRCVCVKNFGPPSSSPNLQEHKDNGDLDHPDLKGYPGCPSSSESCNVSHP